MNAQTPKDDDLAYSIEGKWESRFAGIGWKWSLLGVKNNKIGSRSSSVSSNLSGASIILKDEDSDADIIEGIHTFNMKSQVTEDMPINEESKSPKKSKKWPFESLAQSTGRKGSRSASGNRSYRVEENLIVSNTHTWDAFKILNELTRIINEFRSISSKTAYERDRDFASKWNFLKNLKISFDSEDEITSILKSEEFKVNVRNTLGVQWTEDWIFNLNIGNVMLLSSLQFEDMISSLIIDNLSKRT